MRSLAAVTSGRRVGGTGLVAFALLAGVFAGTAQAQTAFVANSYGEKIQALDTGSLIVAPPISTSTTPVEVAISLDGRTAYVTGYSTGEVLLVDTATDTVTGSIHGFGEPYAIAISPDGATLYVSDAVSESILTVSTATDSITGSPIVLNDWIAALAVSPDGATVYASLPNSNEVVPIDAATRAVGVPIEVGNQPENSAFTPDGSKLYVPDSQDESVSVVDTASNTVIDEVKVELYPERVVTSPDGDRVYVINHGYGQVSVIDTATDEVIGQPVPTVAAPDGAAITADGSRLLVVGSEFGQAELIDTATMTPVSSPPINLGGWPEGVAIVPAQTPVPKFSAAAAAAGEATTFDASASHTYDGRVARYNWDFGDGTSAVDGGPTPAHVYATPGDYQITLTVSNGQGCPGLVFTGVTAICAGPSVASVSEQVTVAGPSASLSTPTEGPSTSTEGPTGSTADPTGSAVGFVPPGSTARSIRVHCPAGAGRGGCRFKLQLVSGRPKRLRNGRLWKPTPEGVVAKLTLRAGENVPVVLHPMPRFAAKIASQSRVLVKRTRVIRGRTRTDFPRLELFG